MKVIRDGSRPLRPVPTGVDPRGFGGEPRAGIRSAVGAVLLDVYGTILVSGSGDIGTLRESGGRNRRIRRLLAREGIRRDPREVREAFIRIVEEDHRQKRRRGVDCPEIRVEEVWREVLGCGPEQAMLFAVEYETIVNPVWPMPGLDGLVERMGRERQGGGRLLSGIISNAQFYTPLQLACFLGAPPEERGFLPELLFYSYRTGHAKPSPFMFREARRVLEGRGIAAGSVLYVGNDMLKDILPAREAGFTTALFAGDGRSLRLQEGDERCLNLKPDLILTDLTVLADHLDYIPTRGDDERA